MKSIDLSTCCLAVLAGSLLCASAQPPQEAGAGVVMRDAASHDELSQKLRMAQQNDPIRDLGPAAGDTEVDPSTQNQPKDFIENSTVISFRGMLTFVPKRAVLHIPEVYEDRLTAVRGAKVQNFQDFLARNRGWIRTIEVSREQALGHKPFSEATQEAIANSSSLVVATYRKGPISVLPPKEPEVDVDSPDTETEAETEDTIR